MLKTVKLYARKAWNWLTSMRTALALLFLLAIAAIPGALLPQRSLNESNVIEYIENNGKLAEFYDKIQLFDVFSSTWFTAIYVLLLISLVGCILPRSWEHYKAMRAPVVRAPRNLERLAHNGEGLVEKREEEVEKDARKLLKGWKITEYSAEEDRAGVRSIAAEKGYTRELFNLIFHLGIVGMIVTAGLGRLFYYEGHVIVVTDGEQNQQNSVFCNTATANYDSFRAGANFDGTGLTTFCFEAHDFSADYLANGQAEMFRSNISYAVGDDIQNDPETWEDYELRVNHPLRIEGDRVYLQGHGFAPTFTVTWPNGETRTQTVQWRPDDPTFFLSSGVVRFDPPAGMYPDLYERRQNQLAIQGLFAPTAEWEGDNNELLTSSYPAMRDPAVAIDIYRGDNGLDTGIGQSLFSLDSSLMHSGVLQKIERVNLQIGDTVTLDDGTTVSFDGASEFANYQISRDPTQNWVLVTTVISLVSLVGSLMIRRRRIWVRFYPQENGTTRVETGGLARTDRAGWGGEYEKFHRELLGLKEEDEDEEYFDHDD
ncbi:cytochrome c biogenesis membrane protein, ResB-family [Corynebacterium glutamicum MB001]|uniref:ResB protein required for cytochrome c biosynthesis n=1 Tax=Corynebacterium glutamicum (strain ATCC 13032 / DSM 20300 / JCM 1318 / BCRC 11384 / CCUG 27702 / LMG 3730 / NBRC 12168 / NCIMB 10025 / NRRL B-2784 / 534) TaxID=196627 RepID=Q8NT69_CORGL|nr:cytochrome c biogenesis protein ResB [Corynebacterium glutamicum]AGT04448.1 cytochrome c biogenesis membrane protein, ResB-family [Corynebacterium glutamicum MB001]ARV65330.1 cytochrome c biogenesis protein [Corynebacterium glutamicum]ASW13227.1 cytochrome c biogenesis membrane protein, ResB-family [Corynebacterium glutamicum]AUI00048.1 cytochrome c biogenesis protein [Corynebacterium glutamicum]AUI03686.1 cytochrome c biogenesis protein [Corynebacterium glutamicum]